MKSMIALSFLSASLLCGLLSSAAYAQTVRSLDQKLMTALEAPPAETVSGEAVLVAPSAESSASAETGGTVPCEECTIEGTDHGNFWTRPFLTGDMGGLRSSLAGQGILFNVRETQFYQGVAGGGRKQQFRYGGKIDYIGIFDGGKLGLWNGLSILFHAETRYAEDINAGSGALSPPNANLLFPQPGHVTAITQLILQQALSGKFAVVGGKFNSLDLVEMLWHTGTGLDRFMNLSLVMPPTLARTTPSSIMGAGLLAMKGREVQGAVLVYDTNNSATTSGFEHLFDQGAVIIGVWKLFAEINGLPGQYSFGGNWSSRRFTSVDPASLIFIPGQGIRLGEETGSWSLFTVSDQMLWRDDSNPNRNVGLYTQFGITDGNPNPVQWNAAVALTANGLVPGREQDSIGVGYFYLGLSSDFKRLVRPVVRVQDTQGVEIYYKAVLTPWFHITADLQVIEPNRKALNTAIIPGLRAQILF